MCLKKSNNFCVRGCIFSTILFSGQLYSFFLWIFLSVMALAFFQCPPGGSFCVFFWCVCAYFSLWWLDFFVLNHAIYAFLCTLEHVVAVCVKVACDGYEKGGCDGCEHLAWDGCEDLACDGCEQLACDGCEQLACDGFPMKIQTFFHLQGNGIKVVTLPALELYTRGVRISRMATAEISLSPALSCQIAKLSPTSSKENKDIKAKHCPAKAKCKWIFPQAHFEDPALATSTTSPAEQEAPCFSQAVLLVSSKRFFGPSRSSLRWSSSRALETRSFFSLQRSKGCFFIVLKILASTICTLCFRAIPKLWLCCYLVSFAILDG